MYFVSFEASKSTVHQKIIFPVDSVVVFKITFNVVLMIMFMFEFI
jgi:hypothetical protein